MAKKKESKLGSAESPREGKEAEEVKGWQEAISTTKNWRMQIEREHRWKQIVEEYGGKFPQGQDLDIPMLPINLVFAYVKTEIARLYFSDPWVTVNPKRIEDLGAARIAEQLINYTWAELDLKRQVKKALLDVILIGHGWIKVGYTAETMVVEQQPKDVKEKGKEGEIITSEFVKDESVFAYHVPWEDVLFSPDSLNPPYDSRWMAFRIQKPLRAIQESDIYENADDLQPDDSPKEGEKSDKGKVQKATLWEIWDMDHKTVCTISPGCEKYLKSPKPWPYEMEGFPAVMFSFNPMPGKPYPISDIAPWENHVIELMKMMSIMTNHLKRWNRQIFISEGAVTDDELKKFTRGVDGAVIRATAQDIGNKIFIPPYAAVQQDIYGIWNLIMEMWRNVSGQSETDRGSSARTQTRTKFELQLTMQGGRARSDEKVDVLEGHIGEVARKLLSLMKQYFTLPKIVRIVGEKTVNDALMKAMQNRPSAGNPGAVTDPGIPGVNPAMMSVTNIDLPEDPDVDVVAGSTLPMNKENKLKIMTEMLQALPMLGIQPGSEASLLLGEEILREVGVKAIEPIIDVARREIGQMKQMQAQQQQMAMAQAQAQHQQSSGQGQVQAQSAAIQLQTEQVRAQAEKEQAKASIIQAELKIKEALVKAHLDRQKHNLDMQKMLLPEPPTNGPRPAERPV